MLVRTVAFSLVAGLLGCSSSGTTSQGTDNSSAGSGGTSAQQGGAGKSGSSATAGGSSSVSSGGVSGAGGPASSAGSDGTSTSGGETSSGGTSSAGMSGSSGAAQAGAGGASNPNPMPGGKQSLIWIWLDYKNSIATVAKNAKSFTHVSPALYELNYAYASGTPKLVNESDNFDGLSSKQISDAVHAAGLKVVPLMYAGAGNGGTDQGIQNVLNDQPAGAQQNFIDATVQEGVAKGYDGINLDWEVQGTNYDQFGAKLITFLTAYTAAMHQHNMVVSFDLGGWYTRQCGDNNALVDLTKVGNSVDQMIMEDYSGSFGNPSQCPATNPATVSCDSNFVAELTVMCNLPKSVVNIGMISPVGGNGGTNPFAADALNAVDAYGFTNVSLWPDDGNFINNNNIPNGGTWYSVLAAWLAKK